MADLNNTLEEVRARMDIVDIVSEYVALKKSGRNWSGLCPFHPEKTPSFMVNREKNIYKCFGCGAGGDGFSFLQNITKKPFAEVLADLASKYGIKVTYSNENFDLKSKIIEINKLTAKYYTDNLFNKNIGKDAKEYLNNRGLSDEIILHFGLGYAPNGWNNLLNHLTKDNNYSLDLLDKAGLVTKKANSDSYYDRFRDRVIIPIHNERGQVIAFGGRSLTEENVPKYLNSPETPVFFKGKNIYALCHAKDSIRKEDSVILVEGYFDAITAHANGITNVVATLGTALTSNQLRLLGKYTESKRFFIAFDADLAGGSATDRGIKETFKTFGGLGGIKVPDEKYINDHSVYEIRIVSIPDGKDPDEFIRNKGAEIFKRLIKNAPQLLEYQINNIVNSNDLTTINGKLKACKELAEILSQISSPVLRFEYIRVAANRISVREEDLVSEINQIRENTKTKKTGYSGNVPYISKRLEPKQFIIKAERNLLSLYFLNEGNWELVAKKLKEVAFEDNNHQAIKASIDSILEECNSVDDLSNKLLQVNADNSTAMEAVSDILFSLEDKLCLKDEKSINLFIQENLACIKRFKAQGTEQGLKQEYYELKNDELKALELQYKVREIVNSRLST